MTLMATGALLLFEQARYLDPAAGTLYPAQAALMVGECCWLGAGLRDREWKGAMDTALPQCFLKAALQGCSLRTPSQLPGGSSYQRRRAACGPDPRQMDRCPLQPLLRARALQLAALLPASLAPQAC